jgi:hypothetical protein
MTDVIRLRSLAGPRIKTADLNPDPYSDPRGSFTRNWNAAVYVCEAQHGASCNSFTPVGPHFRPVHEYVEQWLDRQHYSRHSPGGNFVRESGANGVRDWLEAAVWDALSDAPSQGPTVADACTCVTEITEETGFGEVGEFAHTIGWFQHTTTWLPQNFAWDAWRWNGSFGLLKDGFSDASTAVLTSTALHEARHCWLWTLLEGGGADQDTDFVPGSPESVDPLTLRLKDSSHVWVGGANPEAHFAGDSGALSADPQSIREAQHERDAKFFEMRATAGTPTQTLLTPQLTQAVLDAPAQLPLVITPPGTSMADAIRVTVAGRLGVATPGNTRLGEYPPGGIASVVVEVEVTPEVGLELTPANTSNGWKKILPPGCSNCVHYVAETDTGGVAHFDVQGVEAGTYSVRVVVRQLVAEGNAPSGELLLDRSLTVEVR